MNLAVWIASLSACTYVTKAEFEAQRLNLDEDRDGVSIGDGDCDDADPRVFPGQDEIPYDGIDNDCSGDGDLIDVDGDGQIATEAGGDDCDDRDKTIGVGLDDPPYDGVDSDCARDNDFDADGDGWMAEVATPAAVDAYANAIGITILPRYGDCDDDSPGVYPGATPDPPYDGVDTDCDGANDFDVDGDGVDHPADCLDQPDDQLLIDPELVYPGAPDTPYDGVDADCARDNDFDVDGDGYVRSIDLVAYRRYEALYGWTFDALEGDCDDDLDAVNPEGLEHIDDSHDGNCDGDPDQGTFTTGGLDLMEAEAPHIVSTPDGFVLAASVAHAVLPTLSFDNVVIMALLPPEPGVHDAPIAVEAVLGPLLEPPGPAIGLAATSTGVALGYAHSTAGALLGQIGERTVSGGAFGALSFVPWQWDSPDPPPMAGIQVVGDKARFVTCGGSELGLVVDGIRSAASLPGHLISCFHDANGSTVACTSSECWTWSDLALTDQAPLASPPVLGVRQRPDVRAEVVANVTGVRLVSTDGTVDRAIPSTTVVQADAMVLDDTTYVAVVTDAAELVLTWRPEGSTWRTTTLGDFDPANPDLEPLAVTLAGNDARIVVAVSLSDGIDSALAWSVLGR